MAQTLFVPAWAAQQMVLLAFTELACRLGAALSAILLASLLAVPLPAALAGFPLAGLVLVGLAARNSRRHGAATKGGQRRPAILATLRGKAPFAGAELLAQFYARADLLLIAALTGTAGTGYYATGVKFVEVGLVPLALLGQAAYPLLSRLALNEPGAFAAAAVDLARAILLLGGLLILGLAFVVPPLVVPLFGDGFAPMAALLPWFCGLALLKAGELALYRPLYAARLQAFYLRGLLAGTAVNVGLNLVLIPTMGITGAVAAAVAGAAGIDLVCGFGLRRHLPVRRIGGLALRLALALGPALGAGTAVAGTLPWLPAAFALPLFAMLVCPLGLVPDPRRTPLLGEPGPGHAPSLRLPARGAGGRSWLALAGRRGSPAGAEKDRRGPL